MANRIVIFSGKQFSGKDTLAKIMLERMPTFRRFAMGDVIKDTFAKQKGLTVAEIEANKPFYRPELIKLGDWGRAQDPDFWLKKIISQDGDIFVTDVRKQHEYDVFKAAGAKSIRVESPREMRAQRGQLVNENDLTETELDNVKDWDFVVHNDAGLNELKEKAMHIIQALTQK